MDDFYPKNDDGRTLTVGGIPVNGGDSAEAPAQPLSVEDFGNLLKDVMSEVTGMDTRAVDNAVALLNDDAIATVVADGQVDPTELANLLQNFNIPEAQRQAIQAKILERAPHLPEPENDLGEGVEGFKKGGKGGKAASSAPKSRSEAPEGPSGAPQEGVTSLAKDARTMFEGIDIKGVDMSAEGPDHHPSATPATHAARVRASEEEPSQGVPLGNWFSNVSDQRSPKGKK